MKLFIEGHNIRYGYGLQVCYSDSEIQTMVEQWIADGKPEQPDSGILRYVQDRDVADAIVDRFNRRFATH